MYVKIRLETLAVVIVLLTFKIAFPQGNLSSFLKDKNNEEKTDVRLPSKSFFDETQKSDLLKKKKSTFDLGPLESQSLEAAIDPTTYIVGPGDQFLITIWSTLENSIPAVVTPEGKLIIPTIGAIAVDGKPLLEVQKLITDAASKKYLNSEVSASLSMVRQIRVHVTGQVMNPGLYEALAVHRVSDVIELAGGLTSGAHDRGVEVRHTDGSVSKVDLYKYLKLGNLDANIFLTGGDVVHVPTVDLNQPTVKIEGIINDPGTYQITENESIRDFLLRVDALNRRADLANAYIERSDSTNGHTENIPIFPYLNSYGNGHAELLLQDGDKIRLPQRDEDVYVVGAVQQPGPFPFIPNLTAQDYAGFAGANFQSAKITKTEVIRKVKTHRLSRAIRCLYRNGLSLECVKSQLWLVQLPVWLLP